MINALIYSGAFFLAFVCAVLLHSIGWYGESYAAFFVAGVLGNTCAGVWGNTDVSGALSKLRDKLPI